MRAFEFKTKIQNHTIRIPPELEAKLPAEGQFRVILLAAEEGEDTLWNDNTANLFFSGYAESDSIYDRL